MLFAAAFSDLDAWLPCEKRWDDDPDDAESNAEGEEEGVARPVGHSSSVLGKVVAVRPDDLGTAKERLDDVPCGMLAGCQVKT